MDYTLRPTTKVHGGWGGGTLTAFIRGPEECQLTHLRCTRRVDESCRNCCGNVPWPGCDWLTLLPALPELFPRHHDSQSCTSLFHCFHSWGRKKAGSSCNCTNSSYRFGYHFSDSPSKYLTGLRTKTNNFTTFFNTIKKFNFNYGFHSIKFSLK